MAKRQKASVKGLTRRIGDAGLNEYALNTNRSNEYLTELQGRDGSIKYRQMAKGDPIVGMILRVHKNPIRSAAWNIPYPADVTDEERLAIDIIYDRLFGSSGMEFDTRLGQILSMLEYGFSLFEQYYEPVKNGNDMYLLPTVEQRMQTSIQDILPKERKVRQITIDRGTVEIPFDNLLFFVLNQQGEDMRGESLIRNAYRDYKNKKVYKEWSGIGIQRSVSGVPSMKIPKGTSVTDPDYVAAEQLLQNICQHEVAYMIFPESFEFMIHESKFNAQPVQEAVRDCNSEMALSVLAQFIMLGQQNNSGAFALSRDQSDFFLDGLQHIINLICGVINSQVIEPFLKINFGDRIDPSRVVLSGRNLNKKAGLEFSQVLNALGASGFLRPTVNDEIQLRSNLELPELTEEEVDDRNAKPPVRPAYGQTTQGPVKFSDEPVDKKRKARMEYIENSNKEMLDFMRANLLLIKDKLLADIESTLKRGTIEIQGLKDIEVSTGKYLKGLQMKLAGIAEESWGRAKNNAKANNVKLSDIDPRDVTDKTLKQFALNQAQGITDKQSAAILNRAILTASNNTLKNLSIAQTVSNTSKAIDAYISGTGVIADGALVVVGTANFGESQFYKEIKEQLWGYRFVNNDPVSDLCQWYAGKTFSVDSPELSEATPPLHPNCKSYMEPIFRTENQPTIDDVIPPPSIRAGKTIF